MKLWMKLAGTALLAGTAAVCAAAAIGGRSKLRRLTLPMYPAARSQRPSMFCVNMMVASRCSLLP